MREIDSGDALPLRLNGAARRKRRPHRATVLPACGAIPGMGRVLRNVERRAASRRMCI
jgi:hypothetical protein